MCNTIFFLDEIVSRKKNNSSWNSIATQPSVVSNGEFCALVKLPELVEGDDSVGVGVHFGKQLMELVVRDVDSYAG